ncbi:ankyrin repeat-containing protein NPR4-like [Neltuma alba]|uniref:ankyrin repeat-containing protein NPR4-like n=1 Tax=Neltuma alba TaxID=207710 RepID=UPI0010A31E61|nr:ankyrin repeat-containing protein NPR4-like [Prosopis alba]
MKKGKKEDLESAKRKVNKPLSSSPAVFSGIYYIIWKIVAKEWDMVKEIWERKKKHRLAEELADFLIRQDNSWMDTKHGEPRTEVVVPVIQPSTKKAKLEKTQSLENPIPCKDYTPLLLAASTGIVEIVKKIVDLHPDAISHVSQHDEQNVLHVAVKHRQKNVYKVLKKYGALGRLGSQMANQGRTLLHQVARMDYYDGGNQPGVVFQLQEELRWFERLKRIVPIPYQLFCNDNNLTAKELFDLEHSEMLKEAQEWIKGTAQSCSAVSVLVATVVFAAAYTVPGGIDENGVPVLINSPLFLFFAIMDVVGLASSLVSVMMFLSILTSPFQMQEFYKSLPRKLTMGFTLLFISLTTTLLAFGSTILLTIRMENKKWSSSLIYSATFFPVTLFGLTQFPIVMAIKYRMKRLKKTIKRLIPNDIITISTKPKKKRVYSKYV